jgi:N-acetylmuramoyl-L-alanine amidase
MRIIFGAWGMPLIDRPSPNYDSRNGTSVSMLLLHYTGMPTAAEALARLTDPLAKVSAHYLVDEEGRLYRLVPEGKRAWHAGVSFWAGETDINASSIGIEIANPGHDFGYREFPLAQMAALVALAQEIVARWRIPAARILGHSDVAPARKKDPGELFPWHRLARAGIGLWPGEVRPLGRSLAPGEKGGDVTALQKQLAAFGYGIGKTGLYDEETATVITAFQRHFRPMKVDGIADGQTRALVARLTEQALKVS